MQFKNLDDDVTSLTNMTETAVNPCQKLHIQKIRLTLDSFEFFGKQPGKFLLI